MHGFQEKITKQTKMKNETKSEQTVIRTRLRCDRDVKASDRVF